MLKTLGNDGRKIVPLLSKRKRPSKKDRFKCFHNGIILIVICFNLDNTNIADIIHIKKIFEKMNKKIGYEKDIGSRFRNK